MLSFSLGIDFCISVKTVSQVEFQGEEGTGLGPTLEFYALVAAELQKKDLGELAYFSYLSIKKNNSFRLEKKLWAENNDCGHLSILKQVDVNKTSRCVLTCFRVSRLGIC